MIGVLGIAVLLGLAFVLSEDRAAIRLRTVVGGLGLQLALALLADHCGNEHATFEQEVLFVFGDGNTL